MFMKVKVSDAITLICFAALQYFSNVARFYFDHKGQPDASVFFMTFPFLFITTVWAFYHAWRYPITRNMVSLSACMIGIAVGQALSFLAWVVEHVLPATWDTHWGLGIMISLYYMMMSLALVAIAFSVGICFGKFASGKIFERA
ncbi:MAG: hypothetical protein IAF08_01495 [Rhizobacter sp.]|nr:hypothetical protein [Chlorobiales bacterium]